MKNLILILFPIIIFSQQNNYDIYKGKPINSIASFQFKTSSYYDYQVNSKSGVDSVYISLIQLNTPEGLISQKHLQFLEKNSKEQKNEIYLISRLTITYNLNEFYVIKYGLRENGKIINYEVISFIKKENQWIEDTSNNNVLEDIRLILKLKNNAFSQFEIKEDDPKYPEINKLKPLVKDKDGVMNISKLAEIIEKNKTVLAKYLDE